jgi:hypothetical protein
VAMRKNEPIGTVECPAKGCALLVPVFRFKPRPTEKMQRFANKLYCRCPRHGQFGGAAGDDAMQDYIAEKSTKCEATSAGNGEAEKPANLQKLPAATSAQPTPPKPAPVPAATAPPVPALPAKRSSWFSLE